MNVFSQKDVEVIDWIKVKYKESPVTYGDTVINYLGELIPKELELCCKSDLCS
jgi:hypothetical protein